MARLPDDAYFTPPALALEICRRLSFLFSVERILEPSAGTGSFVAAARQVWPTAKIAAIDLHERHEEACLAAFATRFDALDFLQLRGSALVRADLVLGNPPYSLAEEFVRHALSGIEVGATVAFLLRLSFLGSKGRLLGLFKEHPLRYLIPVAGRPSFTPNRKTDQMEYGVFVWTKGAVVPHPAILHAIEWKGKP